MATGDSVWDVVVEEPADDGQPQGETVEIAIVKKTEVEARQAFAEAVSIARRLHYRSVRLRSDGVVVEKWPARGELDV
jgi:hypothetical protein